MEDTPALDRCSRRFTVSLHRNMRSRLLPLSLLILGAIFFLTAQGNCSSRRNKDQGEFSRYAGDSPSHALPYATDVSSALTRKAVSGAMRKVADWQLKRSEAHYNQDWTFAVLYAGFMAVQEEASGQHYRASMKAMSESFRWQLGPDIMDANDDAMGQTYLSLYALDRDSRYLQPTRKAMDRLLEHSNDTSLSARPLWWWCDGLFMAPPVLATLSQATDDRKYIDFMDHQWLITSGKLYDRDRHLFFRDSRFLDRHEPNGKPLFWARGNGWVMGGLVRVLQAMPKDYPSRHLYVAQLQEMSTALMVLQRPDGLWSAGLLDPAEHPMPETSGSSLITYGITYGINEGLLDRKIFEPCVKRAWEGIVSHIYADGRLGAVQPVADSPGMFKPTSSYVYGVGAFLLAGSEIYKMAEK